MSIEYLDYRLLRAYGEMMAYVLICTIIYQQKQIPKLSGIKYHSVGKKQYKYWL